MLSNLFVLNLQRKMKMEDGIRKTNSFNKDIELNMSNAKAKFNMGHEVSACHYHLSASNVQFCRPVELPVNCRPKVSMPMRRMLQSIATSCSVQRSKIIELVSLHNYGRATIQPSAELM
jgi:hypothetical protein